MIASLCKCCRYCRRKQSINLELLTTSVDRIDEVSKQTVAGVSYKVRGHYNVEGETKDCTVAILERVWHETEKVIISAKCADGSCYVTEAYTCSPKPLTSLF